MIDNKDFELPFATIPLEGTTQGLHLSCQQPKRTNVLERLSFLYWAKFKAQKQALTFRNRLPNCGMERPHAIVLFTDRYVHISGLTTPCFAYDNVKIWIKPDGSLQHQVGEGDIDTLSFKDPIAKPVADILRGLNGFFPFSIYSPLSVGDILSRQPKVLG